VSAAALVASVAALAVAADASHAVVLLQLYEDVWSQGKVLLLNKIMAEEHAQLDRIWQDKPGVGRQRMKRGILAYRKAYPDIV
jgi:hypothetical protein